MLGCEQEKTSMGMEQDHVSEPVLLVWKIETRSELSLAGAEGTVVVIVS